MIYKILRLFEYCQNTGRKDAVVSDTEAIEPDTSDSSVRHPRGGVRYQ